LGKEHHFDTPGKLLKCVHAQLCKTNVGLALFKAMQRQKEFACVILGFENLATTGILLYGK
jgi:hypothetical protein